MNDIIFDERDISNCLTHLIFHIKNDIMIFEKNLELKFNFSENVELIRFEMTDKLKSLINHVYDTELFEK